MTGKDLDADLQKYQSIGAASDLAEIRAELRRDAALRWDAGELREVWRAAHESWLVAKATDIGIVPGSGFALVATGSLGRRELLPCSDLDLLLVHDDMPVDAVGATAEKLWYPLWDANVGLDHSVRTVPEALQVAGGDILAGLAMLDVRYIAGDQALADRLVVGVRDQWRSEIRSRFEEVVDATQARWKRSGEIAHRAEPDLKSGRGGLRDVQLLDALALAQVADRSSVQRPDNPGASVSGAYRTLLDVRTELHRASGRSHDLLLAQYADEIGVVLGMGDRYDLAGRLSVAARTISDRVDAGLRVAAGALATTGTSVAPPRLRRPLDEGVVEYAGEVVLARDARPAADAGLVLRVAAAAATTGIPIADSTLNRLAQSSAALAAPWPQRAREDLLALLTAGPHAVDTIRVLDRAGLWSRLLPEWEPVRDLPPRDAVHIWTVDRHLVETVSWADVFATRVGRPDLLVLAALLHDIGKGRSGDHSVIGAQLATEAATRIGVAPGDVVKLATLVHHHLLLPVVATSSDLDDPEVIARVAEALHGDAELLDVMHALTEADALATGPGVWSDWKASLVAELVRRCKRVMPPQPLPCADPVDVADVELAAERRVQVKLRPDPAERTYRVVMVARDQQGLLSKAAGVLTFNALRVYSASVNLHADMAINEFVVSPRFGAPPAAALLHQQFTAALGGSIDVVSRAVVAVGPPIAPPMVTWHDDPDGRQIVVIRAKDRTGLLARLAAALDQAGADIVWATARTWGSVIDNVFCVASSAPRATIEDYLRTELAPETT